MAKHLGICLFMVMLIFAINVQPVDAATYTHGKVKFDDLAQTPDFYLTAGPKVLSLTKQATKDASFEIQLTNSNGDVVDKCVGDAYTFQSKGKCYFHAPANGEYYLTFVNYSPKTSVITMKYRLHD